MKSKEPEPTTENPEDSAKVEKTLDEINRRDARQGVGQAQEQKPTERLANAQLEAISSLSFVKSAFRIPLFNEDSAVVLPSYR